MVVDWRDFNEATYSVACSTGSAASVTISTGNATIEDGAVSSLPGGTYVLLEVADGVTVEEVVAATGAPLEIALG